MKKLLLCVIIVVSAFSVKSQDIKIMFGIFNRFDDGIESGLGYGINVDFRLINNLFISTELSRNSFNKDDGSNKNKFTNILVGLKYDVSGNKLFGGFALRAGITLSKLPDYIGTYFIMNYDLGTGLDTKFNPFLGIYFNKAKTVGLLIDADVGYRKYKNNYTSSTNISSGNRTSTGSIDKQFFYITGSVGLFFHLGN
jgi:hypothetical protein